MWDCFNAAAASVRAGLVAPCESFVLRLRQEGPGDWVVKSMLGSVSHSGEGHTRGVADAVDPARGVFLLWSMGM